MLSPYVQNVSAYDAYGNPLWDSGQMSLGGVGQTAQMLNQYDGQLSNQLGSQLVDPVTGQLIRQPTTPGEAAAAADAMEQFYQRQTNQQNQYIMNLLGGGQNMSSYGTPQGGSNFTGSGAASGTMTVNPYGQAVNSNTGIAPGGGVNALSSIGVGANGAPLSSLGSAQIGANGSIGAFTPAQSNGYQMGGTRPMTGGQTPTYGGSFGGALSAGGGAGGAGGAGGFRPQFEQQLYQSMINPGLSEGAVNSIINKGTEEIAEGERNSLNQLQNKAGAQQLEGGAVSGANREVLSDFGGKRANLARDVRVQAELSKQNEKLGALRAGSDYFGKLDDNARADRNQLIQFLLSSRNGSGAGGGGNGSPFEQFSGLMSQAGRNGGLAYNMTAGGSTGSVNNTPTTAFAQPGGFGSGFNPYNSDSSTQFNSYAQSPGTQQAAQPKPAAKPTEGLDSRWGAQQLEGQGGIVGFTSNHRSKAPAQKSFSSLMRS